ncbi:MAG: alpha-ketoacid dehydrogenase subunit beta [Thermaerobacter sp.]|nr:alpha-ketoacid dehydrogenase subunit beta [Thermaerobacter sp.]
MEMTYAAAVRYALEQEMERDPRVFIMGEDIGVYGGAFGVTMGLVERFGKERVRDTPIAEEGIVGAGIGASLVGMRPIVEIQFSDFIMNAMDQVVNQAAKIHFMFGGRMHVPLVIRGPAGAGTGAAAQHSQSLEAWFHHVPGLKVVMPATPDDARGLLLAAIRDPNPVIMFEHKLLYKMKGEVEESGEALPLGQARIARPGRDATLVTYSFMVHRVLEAATLLAGEGWDIEVIDLRTIVPMDLATVTASVGRTGRLAVCHEAVGRGGIGGEIAARVWESEAFDFLDAPLLRITGLDTPVPYSPPLEQAFMPSVERIHDSVKSWLTREGAH